MQRAKSLMITMNCPHCGEAVELPLIKKQIKTLYTRFKLPIETAQQLADKECIQNNS